MKNHLYKNGVLYQTNKKFSALKEKQKLQINAWLYEEFKQFRQNRIDKDSVSANVMLKIEKAGIWIPEREIEDYYHSCINQFNKRYEKEAR